VTSLEAFERPPALPEGSVNQYKANTSIADIATHKNRSLRTKDNRLDSRPPKRLYNTRSQSQSNKRRRDPSPSPSESSSSVASDSSIPSIDPHSGRCYYCGRKGHIQTDCDEYNKGRHRSHRKYGGKGVKKAKKESRIPRSSHIALADRRPSPPF
jgi:hypothetical protein